MLFKSVHHIAIICSNYQISKKFYTEIMGFSIIHEAYREARDSYKLDLQIDEYTQIELFSFPNPPKRVSKPEFKYEACGLRHLAFKVSNVDEIVKHLTKHNIFVEPIRVDEFTGKRFTFFADPDDLPLEVYEEA